MNADRSESRRARNPRRRPDFDVLPPERHAPEVIQREVAPPVHLDGHRRIPSRGADEERLAIGTASVS
jgi:hypothetical protein